MRVGKSGVVTCDFCGKVLDGSAADSMTSSGVDQHFCPGTCMGQYLMEHLYGERITEEVERRVREEFKTIHQQVCPACRFRLRRLL